MSELTRSMARGAIGLGLFAVVTVGIVAVTHSLTAGHIADNRLASQHQALGQVVPEAMHDGDLLDHAITLPAAEALGQPSEFTAWRARKNGRIQAVILPVIAHDGYSGDISLLVGIDAGGELTGVRVLAHKETPGLGDKIEVRKSDWITQFAGLSLDDPPIDQWAVKKDGGAFDAFTGATITPRAVIGTIRRSLEYFAANRAILLGEPEGDDP
ncbi:electron transport complex protein RnfG [Modicisalibacter muralis]|uniref:Ion-translocating oxidoreductase complex subunit G n=1 Tax=Modicisalibacter muralis TaxID=119000 RepID=A0A1G9FFE7_9GAMM|nr:electron transport complex subunit RsxG [Halomonas muralis]SDK87089.1 electron transport complex protein RnfG [Halomonas muralis]